ncbi:hypothetical protein ILUMI_06129 [Ignelater luminosus]|uniref:Uncharacterized protein n=1 Tax=Ignelater luminosus TaxID=2038154 RepID=A0A8K0GCW3_IGNLU|nr:hypothetical protein ILUMI_06129 [Ignelater luminosus]
MSQNNTPTNQNSETSSTSNNTSCDSKMDTTNHASCLYPGVKLREKRPQTNQEKSETQRKRNSKNRLSNRRSTGFVTPEEIEEAMSMQAAENL